MSKQYKHKKTGSIVTWDEGVYKTINSVYVIPVTFIENSNDWEEIIEPITVEKDYEILSFKQNSGITDLWIRDETTIQEKWSRGGKYTTPYSTQELLNNPLYSIYSVKRLSDGELFTIGDKVIDNVFGKLEITSFINDKGAFTFKCLDLKSTSGSGSLRDIQYYKTPLFTTEDGKEIFEGDVYHCINTKLWTYWYTLCNKNTMLHKDYKAFSTCQAAEEYITMLKPQFSLREILDVYFENGNFADKIKFKARNKTK